MAVERDFELLDDYVANRLSGDEKALFEKQMQADPELQREYALQQNLVEGIRKARALELKAMLNNTPIPPVQPGQTLLLAKIAAGVLVSGAVVTGIYYYMNGSDPVVAPANTITETAPVADEPVVEEPAAKEEVATPVVTPENPPVEDSKKKVTTKKQSVVTETPAKPEEKIKNDVYNPADEAGTESVKTSDVASNESKGTSSTVAAQTVSNDRKHQFHYQVKAGKPILYGSFESGLYTILDIFHEKHTMFLFYKEKYYLLNDADDKIKPLVPITDPTLINKLKEYRGN